MLAYNGASGGLRIVGRPGGVVYLKNGYLTYAETSAVPDLGTRLVRSGCLTADDWRQVSQAGQPGDGVGAALAASGLVAAGELQQMAQSTALDALLALTASFAGDCSLTGTVFVPQQSHWAETVLTMDIGSVWTYLQQKTQRLAWYDIGLLDCPRLCDLTRSWAVVDREQWQLACRIDGHADVRDLAWLGGFALHDTMESVGRLARAGLCALSPRQARPAVSAPAASGVSAPPRIPAGVAAAASPVVGTPATPAVPVPDELPRAAGNELAGGHAPLLPRRIQGATRQEQAGQAAGVRARMDERRPAGHKMRPAPLDIGLLRQVLRGLEQLG
ncbi:MAG: hypothetical protein ABSF03_00245 [Streptosporangiaceae bacterium]|jgi:hypothetical protein